MPVNTLSLLADTTSIRTFGAAHNACAADLATAATTLSSLAPPDLGPVGARFLAAFTAALADHSAAVGALSAAAQRAGAVASANADAFEASGVRASLLLPQV